MAQISEAKTVGQQKKRAAVMVGRFSPPTAGHYKVIDSMKAFIRDTPDLGLIATPVVVIVDGDKSSKDHDKNPLTAEERMKFMQASGRANGVKFLTAKSGFDAFEVVREDGMEPIAIAAGSDRSDKYLDLLNKYFKTQAGEDITHVAIPGLEREEAPTKKKEKKGAMQKALDNLKEGGELDVAEVSGSLARHAVELGYEEEFAKIVGLEKKPQLAKLLFDKIKKSMGVEDAGSV